MNVEQPRSGSNSKNKQPVELSGKIEGRYEKFVNEAIGGKSGIIKALIKAVMKKLGQMKTRIEKMFEKLNPVCEFHTQEEITDSERQVTLKF